MNPFGSTARVDLFTNAPRPALRHRRSVTSPDARNNDTNPDAAHRDAYDNRTFLVLDCTKFQHALASAMRGEVVIGVASC